jgi:hypothetical protein
MGEGEGPRVAGRPGGQEAGKPSSHATSGGTPGKRSLTEDLLPREPTVTPGAPRDHEARPAPSATTLDGAARGAPGKPLPRLDLPSSGVGGHSASNTAPSSVVQRGPAASAPPDLGNYDSAIGKHVLVLRGWDKPTIAARRVELQGLLSRTTDAQVRDELLREDAAIEWVARERNLALPKDPGEEAAPPAFLGGKPTRFWVPDSAQGMRAMLEREMAAGTGYGAARAHAQQRIDFATTSRSATDNDKHLIGRQQTALMDHDAAAFRAGFQVEARQTALAMLDASTGAIDAALRSYGIVGGAFRLTDAAHKVAKDPDCLDVEVDTWVALSSRLDDNQAAFAGGHAHRDDLAKTARQLHDLQDNLAALAADQLRLLQQVQAQHPEHAGMPRPATPDGAKLDTLARQPQPMQGSASNPFDQLPKPPHEAPEQRLAFVQQALQTRRAQFQAAWIEAEHAHPVLAAYRGGKPPDASRLVGMGSDEATMRSVIQHVLPRLGNIYRTQAALHGAWGTLDPLQLGPVVALAKQRMFVAEGSYRERTVHDMVEQAHEAHGGLVPWALEAVMLGFTLVTLVPTAGTSAMAGLALAGLAYDIYAGLGEYEDVKLTTAATDTDLDKLRSLSDTEPSLTPLLTRIVGAGVNVTMAAGLFRRAVALRRMALGNAVDHEALAALNQAGEAIGVRGVGDEAVTSGGGSAVPPSHSASPHTTTVELAERTGAQIKHPAGGAPGPYGAVGKSPGFDARPRITSERLHEMSRRLGVPVAIDNTGTLRDGIELQYVLGPKGTIRPAMLRVGRGAIVDDILAHGAVIDRVTRYNGVLGKLRRLWDRLVALLQRARQPIKPGTPVWRSYQELLKLDDLIALRQSARMGQGVVNPEILDREIEFFQGYYAHHEAIVAEGEKLGAYGRPTAGHIDSPDRWRESLGGDDPSIGGMHEIDPLGKEPHQNRLPVAKEIDPTVPPARANSGFWEDEHAKGNTPWHSDNRKVNEITGYKPVEYKDGYPVLDPYTQETVYLKRMLGDDRDFGPADRMLAKRRGQFKADGMPDQGWAHRYRQRNRLTWHHHQGGTKMQLVPRDLHFNIPHVGGASATRDAVGLQEGPIDD